MRSSRSGGLAGAAQRLAALAFMARAAVVDLTRPCLDARSLAFAGGDDEAMTEGVEALLAHLAEARRPRLLGDATTVREPLLVAAGLLSARAIVSWAGGVPTRLALVVAPQPPSPAALQLALGRPAPPTDVATAMLRALGSRWSVPAAIVERGRLHTCTDELWATLGVRAAAIGTLVLDPHVHAAAARIERAAGGARDPALRVSRLAGGLRLVEAADPESARCAVEIRRIGDRYKLTPCQRIELGHLLRGRSSIEAAAIDGVSPETSRERRRSLYKKTGASGAGRLRALAAGLTD